MNTRTVSALVSMGIIVAALTLILIRGGLIAWAALLIGVALAAKAWLKPTPMDRPVSIVAAAVLALSWIGTHHWVIGTWESGEVVELAIPTDKGTHIARLWVLDINENPLVYYDAHPHAAKALLAGTPIEFTRSGEVSTRIPKATLVEDATEAEANRVLEAMATKYGARNSAATIYYVLLGQERDRVPLVAELIAQEG